MRVLLDDSYRGRPPAQCRRRGRAQRAAVAQRDEVRTARLCVPRGRFSSRGRRCFRPSPALATTAAETRIRRAGRAWRSRRGGAYWLDRPSACRRRSRSRRTRILPAVVDVDARGARAARQQLAVVRGPIRSAGSSALMLPSIFQSAMSSPACLRCRAGVPRIDVALARTSRRRTRSGRRRAFRTRARPGAACRRGRRGRVRGCAILPAFRFGLP